MCVEAAKKMKMALVGGYKSSFLMWRDNAVKMKKYELIQRRVLAKLLASRAGQALLAINKMKNIPEMRTGQHQKYLKFEANLKKYVDKKLR